MELQDLIRQQRTALQNDNVEKALELLGEIEEELEAILERQNTIEEKLERANAWRWLQRNEPESYEQLIEKVEHAANRKGYSAGGRSELLQLAWVFEQCEKLGIDLSLFDLPGHLGNYREAASYMRRRVQDASTEDEARKEIHKVVKEINSHRTRRETRAMVR